LDFGCIVDLDCIVVVRFVVYQLQLHSYWLKTAYLEFFLFDLVTRAEGHQDALRLPQPVRRGWNGQLRTWGLLWELDVQERVFVTTTQSRPTRPLRLAKGRLRALVQHSRPQSWNGGDTCRWRWPRLGRSQ